MVDSRTVRAHEHAAGQKEGTFARGSAPPCVCFYLRANRNSAGLKGRSYQGLLVHAFGRLVAAMLILTLNP